MILESDGSFSVTVNSYGSKLNKPVNVDVTFGYLNGDPVFFLLWGERSSPVNGSDGQPWNGIWSDFIDAQTHNKVGNSVFPVSIIWAHQVDAANAGSWRPVAAYNKVANTFAVSWRETPSPHANNVTNEKHIRANTRDSTSSSVGSNVVVSATGGAENPTLPAIASSTTSNKTLIAWEDHRGFLAFGDIYGSFMDASSKGLSAIQPTGPVSGRSFWKQGTTGYTHSLGLRQGDDATCCQLWGWGYNTMGQLGLGHNSTQSQPQQRVGSAADWVEIVAGAFHSLGIRADGSLWAWGGNLLGQLGLGHNTDQNSPQQVGGAADWVAAAAGEGYSLGIRRDGSLWAWGENSAGQLGLGDNTNKNSPHGLALLPIG